MSPTKKVICLFFSLLTAKPTALAGAFSFDHCEGKEDYITTGSQDNWKVGHDSSSKSSLKEDFKKIVKSRDLSKNAIFLVVVEPLKGKQLEWYCHGYMTDEKTSMKVKKRAQRYGYTFKSQSSPHIIENLLDYCLIYDRGVGRVSIKSRIKALYFGQQPICSWCGKSGLFWELPLPKVHEAPFPNYASCRGPIEIDGYKDRFHQVMGTSLHVSKMQHLWLSMQEQWIATTRYLEEKEFAFDNLKKKYTRLIDDLPEMLEERKAFLKERAKQQQQIEKSYQDLAQKTKLLQREKERFKKERETFQQVQKKAKKQEKKVKESTKKSLKSIKNKKDPFPKVQSQKTWYDTILPYVQKAKYYTQKIRKVKPLVSLSTSIFMTTIAFCTLYQGCLVQWFSHPPTMQRTPSSLPLNHFSKLRKGNFLHTLIRYNDKTSIRLLLENSNIDINEPNAFNQNAAHIAVQYHQDPAFLAYLSYQGAQLHLADTGGYTPLMNASSLCHESVVNYLTRFYEVLISLDAVNLAGETALMQAVKSKCMPVVDRLTKIGKFVNVPQLNIQNNNNMTALMIAASTGQYRTVRHLIKAGANPYPKNYEELNALMLCIRFPHKKSVKIVRFLVKHHKNLLKEHGQQGTTPLILAATYEFTDMIVYLVEEAKVDINEANTGGMTPLMIANYIGNQAHISYLMRNEADPRRVDENGTMAVGYAIAKTKKQSEKP
ncbi:MAG: ankyrin repeat domain-containing protein [Bacteroidota bacterium]